MGEASGGWSLVGVFTVYDLSNEFNYYTLPRLTPPMTPTLRIISKTPQQTPGVPNSYNLLTVPIPARSAPRNPALGISDFGPYPAGMMARNQFRDRARGL
jgi:hypothetical protein